MLSRVREKSGDFGFDAMREEYCDLTKAGVIDPVKVVRIALQNAARVAGLLLTTETAIADMPEPPKGGGPGGAGAAGMGDMDMGF